VNLVLCCLIMFVGQRGRNLHQNAATPRLSVIIYVEAILCRLIRKRSHRGGLIILGETLPPPEQINKQNRKRNSQYLRVRRAKYANLQKSNEFEFLIPAIVLAASAAEAIKIWSTSKLFSLLANFASENPPSIAFVVHSAVHYS